MNKKLLLTPIYLLIIIATISSALAVNTNITTLNNAQWMRLDSDLMAVNENSLSIDYYSSSGHEKTISISPYSSTTAILYGETDSSASGDIYWVCDKELLCVADYSAGNLQTINITSVVNAFTGTPYNDLVNVGAVTDDFYAFTYGTSAFNDRTELFYKNNLSKTTTTTYALCHDDANGDCSYAQYETYNGQDYVYYCKLSPTGSFTQLTAESYEYNNQLFNSSTTYSFGFGTDWYQPNSLENGVGEGRYLYCGGTASSVSNPHPTSRIDMQTGTDTTPFPTTLFTESVNSSYYDSNNDDETLIIDDTTNEIFYFQGANYVDTNINNADGREAYTLSNGGLIYKNLLNATNTVWTLTDDLSILVVNDTENGTFVNVTIVDNETFTGSTLRTLQLDSDLAIIGLQENGQDQVKVYNTTSGLSLLTSINFTNPIYSTSNYNNRLFVTTEEGVWVYDNYQTTPSYVDNEKYGILKNDDMQDVVAINNTKAFVCDNNDEVDYYEIGSNPTGNLGGGCYDIELTNTLLFVDGDEEGINVYNPSNPSNPSYLTTIDYRQENHEETYGDFIDVRDNYIVITKDLYGFTVLNASSLDLIAQCNTGLGGKVRSVEVINENLSVAGLHNGKIAFCDYDKLVGFNFTENYEVSSLNEESINFIEYDGVNIHLLGETIYSKIQLNEVNIFGNNPPSFDEVILSTLQPEINETLVITLTPNDVDPEDVILYGFKCSINDTVYFQNTLGEYECLYSYSGSETITVAITDNYHNDEWYDVTTININILPTTFTGGLLRVEVSDSTNDVYVEGAIITADGKNTTTDSFGRATITTDTTGSFLTTIEKTGYQTQYQTITANGVYEYIDLQPESEAGTTNLLVTVVDEEHTPIEQALVSFTNIITYEYDYDFTNANGQVYFSDLSSGQVIIQASKEGLEEKSETISVNNGLTTTRTLTLEETKTGGSTRIDRDCIDDGLFLCGDMDVIETSCVTNDDCPYSNHCTAGLNTCSRFNYSACDEEGLPRDQKCVLKLTSNNALSNVTNWILTNLLYVIILLILLISAGMVFIAWKK